jgi:hypothetical protein
VRGPGVDWEIRTKAGTTSVADAQDGAVRWCRGPGGERLRVGMQPDEVALVLLLVHARVPETTSAWSFLRYV